MEYSKYQLDIFEEIKSGVGNLLIEACAGSGKTTTLINALNHINENKKILFCAFNTDIVKELEKKIGKKDNIEITTIHGLGRKIVRLNLRKDIELNEYKYSNYLYNNLHIYAEKYHNVNKNNLNEVIKLVSLMRDNLADNEHDGLRIINKYGINCTHDELLMAVDTVRWGTENTDVIDYTDMIYLPSALNMQPWKCQYDYIFVDEAQDLSAAQLSIVLKCQKINTRFVFVGDPNQAIYGFSGSDAESFDNIKRMANMKLMPLSISYRCAKKIVTLAQTIVPSIQYNESSPTGEIVYDADLNDVVDGDMIICRNNAPLMEIYYNLLREGKKCYIKGKDIGTNLINMINSTYIEVLNPDMKEDGVFARLNEKLNNLVNNIMNTYNIDEESALNTITCTSFIDKINALKIISENFTTASEVKAEIEKIFIDNEEDGISLSTVHKSKGLEANNVFIAFPSLMPSKSAKLDWEIKQEKNLKYVAFTRAKLKLCFLKEDKDSIFLKKNNYFKFKPKTVHKIDSADDKPNNIQSFEKRTIKKLGGVNKQVQNKSMFSFKDKTIKLNKL